MDSQDILSAAAELPTTEDVTLLFKYHKSTTFLSISPTLSLAGIKARLLTVLRSRGAMTFPSTSIPLPSNSNDLEFGVLADRKDASKGWVLLEGKDQEVTDVKGGKRNAGNRKSVTGDNPIGAGLTDGTWIAYRIKAGKNRRDGPNTAGSDIDDILDIDMGLGEEQNWDVVIPNFEDEAE